MLLLNYLEIYGDVVVVVEDGFSANPVISLINRFFTEYFVKCTSG